MLVHIRAYWCILVHLHNNKALNVKLNLSPPSNTEIHISDRKYTYRYISASEQGRSLSQTRQFVRCSIMCESGVEVEPGKMLQSVLVHNSDTLKGMYCDVCAVY